MGCDPAVDRQYYENTGRSATCEVKLYQDAYREAKLPSDLRGNQLSQRMIQLVDTNRREHDRGWYLVTENGGYSKSQLRKGGLYAGRTSQVADIRVHERAGNDAPPVERLPVRAVRPPDPGIRVGVEVASVIELLLRRLLQLLWVHGECRYCMVVQSIEILRQGSTHVLLSPLLV